MLCRVHGIRTQRNIPPSPPFKGGKSEAKGDVTPSKGEERKRSVGEKAISPLGGL